MYSPLHGTGSAAICPLLKRLNIKHDILEEQMVQDGNFPIVKSPNPENPEAMKMATEHAKLKNADIAMVTDPDGNSYFDFDSFTQYLFDNFCFDNKIHCQKMNNFTYQQNKK